MSMRTREGEVADAKIVEDLHETVYGERQYGVEDLEATTALLTARSGRKPDEWGATVSDRPQSNPPTLGVGYLSPEDHERTCY